MVLKINLASSKGFLRRLSRPSSFQRNRKCKSKGKYSEIKIKSALLRNDFRMKKTFF
jgi:hypothetical protein